MIRIKWLVGGRTIPTLGMAVIGKTAHVPDKWAKDFEKQGIAEIIPEEKEEKKEKKSKKQELSRDELVHALIEKGIDPPDNANKDKLEKLLKEANK